MKLTSPMTKWFLVSQWERWHQARQMNPAPVASEASRQQTQSAGADGFDGLIARGVPFQYDVHCGHWFYYDKAVGS